MTETGKETSREDLPVGKCIRGWGWALEEEEGTSVEETRESSRKWVYASSEGKDREQREISSPIQTEEEISKAKSGSLRLKWQDKILITAPER